MTKLPYLASGASLWRGYDYYTAHKVLSWEPTEPGGYPQQFDGVVSGNGDKPYEVHIDIAHPKKSTCTCPFAEGRHVICKHMVALYFTIYPAEADELLHAQEQWEAEDQVAAKAEYRAVVGSDLDHPGARRFQELTAAFTAGDRAAFEAAKAEGLAALTAAEGV